MLPTATADLHGVTWGATLVALVPCVVVAMAVAPWLARRWRTTIRLAGAASASVAVVLAVTLLGRVIGGVHEPPPPPWESFTSERAWRHVLVPDADWWRNVALFVPAGAFGAMATRRPARTVVALVALSVAIEAGQHAAWLGHADPADLVTNGLGATLGVVAAGAVWRRRPAAVPATR